MCIRDSNRIAGTIRSLNGATCGVEVAGGHLLEALKVNFTETGRRTTLSIRPERVEIDPQAADIANRLTGTVAGIIYLGDHVRVHVKVPGSDDFVVKAPNKDGTAQFKAGQDVTVGWRTKDCRALDAA